MLVFILLTMFMGGVIMLSASLLYLNSEGNHFHDKRCYSLASPTKNNLIYDDMELPSIDRPLETKEPEQEEASPQSNRLLDFTRTSQTSAKQLPLMGMPDKAFYHIH